ncbi:MAG: cytochrome C [SAR202 cluster bacterium]|nr:cytochrome C [SAR202 cluster bacterium]
MLKRTIVLGAVAAILLLAAIQLAPYGRDHYNPPVTGEPAWKGAQTRALTVRACFDCHSNETVWPWYSNVAPVSWLVQRDVQEGRDELNFSQWDAGQEGDHAAETVTDGSMPPRIYLLTHPAARLSDAERQVLAQGLAETLGDYLGEGDKDKGKERDR